MLAAEPGVSSASDSTCLHNVSCHVVTTGGLRRCAPAFAVVGTPKSGTTSVFAYLSQHPLVQGPRQKELRAFAPTLAFTKGHRLTIRDYTRLFPLVKPTDCNVAGEASPAYFYHPLAARFFTTQASSVKLIILLRHPVGRWLSEFHQRLGLPSAKQVPHRGWMMAPTFAVLVDRAEKV